MEADALLADSSDPGAAFRAPVGSTFARAACASAALAATVALAAALSTRASSPAGGAQLLHRQPIEQLVELEEKTPARAALGKFTDLSEDDVDTAKDPCVSRRKLTDLDDLKNLDFTDSSDTWDPCKVSKEAAVKAEKMLKQAAHWEQHKSKSSKAAASKSKSSDAAAASKKKSGEAAAAHAPRKNTGNHSKKKDQILHMLVCFQANEEDQQVFEAALNPCA